MNHTHTHTQNSSTILEQRFDVEISASNSLPRELYSTFLSLFLRKTDDGHCRPKHVVLSEYNIQTYEVVFFDYIPIY